MLCVDFPISWGQVGTMLVYPSGQISRPSMSFYTGQYWRCHRPSPQTDHTHSNTHTRTQIKHKCCGLICVRTVSTYQNATGNHTQTDAKNTLEWCNLSSSWCPETTVNPASLGHFLWGACNPSGFICVCVKGILQLWIRGIHIENIWIYTCKNSRLALLVTRWASLITPGWIAP